MKEPKDFRVLLVYPNLTMMLVPSLAMALFTGILRWTPLLRQHEG